MSEAATGANIAPAQPLHIKRTSERWLIAAALTIVVAGIVPIILMSRSISNSQAMS
jgi:hypothetical protein